MLTVKVRSERSGINLTNKIFNLETCGHSSVFSNWYTHFIKNRYEIEDKPEIILKKEVTKNVKDDLNEGMVGVEGVLAANEDMGEEDILAPVIEVEA